MSEVKKFGIPLWIGWLINAAAWGLFVATMNPAIEIVMGIACLFAMYIGIKHKGYSLIFSSIIDAGFMFFFAFGMH
jgi:hypothetical protein